MPDWKALVRARLAASSLQASDDVVDEIAEHAAAVFERHRAGGAGEEDALARVENELEDLGALVRAAQAAAARRARHIPAPSPPAAGPLQAVRAFAADLVYSARLMPARPGFTAVTVLTLALGIGANTAIFSVVYALLLAPLPFADPERLVLVWEADAANSRNAFIVSAPNWLDWRAQSTTLQDFAIWEFQSFNLSGVQEPEQVPGLRVSSSAFALFGVRPQLGRTFTAAEDEPGHRVVILSDALWTRRLRRDPRVIGQTVRLNGEPYEVIGVMPESFRFVQSQALWVPIQFTEQDRERGAHSFFAAARLKEGATFENAQAEMAAIGRRLAGAHPANRGETATITRMADFGVQPLRPTLYALIGAVTFVLLIACVNVANLMLAQAASRQREFAIRAALGAGRGRLASQLLAEGLLMAAAGGAAGVLLAWLATTAMSGSLPPMIQLAPFRNAGAVSLAPSVLAFTSLIAMITGTLFSLAPMIGAARTRPGETLKTAGDRGGTARLTVLRKTLVAAELSLAVVVLFGAGLMIKSVARLVSVDPGVDAENVLVMDIALPQKDTYGPPERTSFCIDLAREVSALPGVRSVGAISHLPLSGANAGRGLTIEGRPIPTPDQAPGASYRLTCPGYFATLGISLAKGRDFDSRDVTTGPGVVIINEEFARRHFAGQDPIGHRIKLGGPNSPAPWMTIVGVARNVRHFGLDSPVRAEIFRPYSQSVWPSMTITIKTAVDPLMIAAAVKAALRRIDPDQPVSSVRTLKDVIADSIGGRRFPMLLLAVFSGVALVLAAIGVYGVVSYLVSQRTREMGIRLALGARRRQVTQLVMGGSLRPIAAGLVAGGAAAVISARLLSALLYAVTPSDPVVLAVIVGILGTTAAVASWLPARRAAAVDPLVALRDE